MKNKKNTTVKVGIVFWAFLIGLWPNILKSQTTLNTSGGSKNLTSGIFYYSIGEMAVVNTHSNDDITLTQGLLQIESLFLGIKEEPFTNRNLMVFPNPVKNTLSIQPSLQSSGELSVKLYDLLGRRILQKTFFLQTGLEKQNLNLSALQAGTYMLNVQFNHGNLHYRQTYKIIKSNIR